MTPTQARNLALALGDAGIPLHLMAMILSSQSAEQLFKAGAALNDVAVKQIGREFIVTQYGETIAALLAPVSPYEVDTLARPWFDAYAKKRGWNYEFVS